jgi:aspartyl-tRNA synthetase
MVSIPNHLAVCVCVYLFIYLCVCSFSLQNMPTGRIEVVLKDFKVINPAKKQLPFVIRDFNKVSHIFDKH